MNHNLIESVIWTHLIYTVHKRAISKKGRTLSHLWWICGWRTPQEMRSIKSFLFPTYFRRCWCNNGLHCSQMLNEGDTIKFNTKKEPDPTHLPFHAKKCIYTQLLFQSEVQLVNLKNTARLQQSSTYIYCILIQWCRNRVFFGRSVNSIPTRGADSAHPLILAPQTFFTFRHPCNRSNQLGIIAENEEDCLFKYVMIDRFCINFETS